MANFNASSSAADRSGGETSTSEQQAEDEIRQYVQFQTQLFQQLDKVADKPLRVRNIRVTGLERTKDDIVQQELLGLLEAQTFGELRELIQECYISLMNLDIFTAVNLTIDEPAEEGAGTCDIIMRAVEKQRLGLHLGGYVQGTEGTAEAVGKVINPLGYAEQLEVRYEIGHQALSEFAVKLGRQRVNASPYNVNLQLHQQNCNNEKWSSHRSQTRGGVFSVMSEDGQHTVSYELGWRQLTDTTREKLASTPVKQQLGHSLKSAVRYDWRHDTFDDPSFPRAGYGIRSSTEVAGLWADPRALKFVKQVVHGQWVKALSPDAVFSLQASTGVLLPWGPGYLEKCSPISERFSCGGVSADMRGFRYRGLGQTAPRKKQSEEPTSEMGRPPRDYLGGDLFCTVLAAIRFQLPWARLLYENGVYGQIFANGCNNTLLTGQHRHPRDILADFKSTFRCSVGASLVFPLPMGCLEAGMVRVLRPFEHDGWRHGIYVGLSASPF